MMQESEHKKLDRNNLKLKGHIMNLIETYDDFLTYDDIAIIREKIFNLREYWRDFTQYFSLDMMQDKTNMIHRLVMHGMEKEKVMNKVIDNLSRANVLSDVIYMNAINDTPFNYEAREIMIQEFGFLYDKLKIKLSQIFDIPIEKISFYDDLTVPGFHVFEGPLDFWLEGDIRWHQDGTILQYKHGTDLNKVHSLTTPIQLPKNGSWVEFQDPEKISNNETLNHQEIDFNEHTVKHNYEMTKLHHWKGNLWHALGSDELEEGDYRITFQVHAHVDDDEIKIYF